MRLRDLREDADLTQGEIAKLLNICQSAYCQYETAKRQIPIDDLIRLAHLYNTSVDYLLGITNVRAPYPRIKTPNYLN